ncbi:hypothetical protein FHL15_008063 [Xylaria flabelliformis]|uniref:AA1-like domain-containing protein n=1 Tax=Xylaria flabelliformis TaxID=2512241 RepID=A0A553HT22_9PEZI|nr:hypothetical protein FHL15_008063 [Xylaria flabelliformis]
MRNSQAIFKSLLLAATIAGTATALPANQTGIDGPDINAGWTFEAFSDGSCRINIYNAVGNTDQPCTAVPQQAFSYRFMSTTDPATGASFAANLYSSVACQNRILTDDGKNGNCNTVLFESYNIVVT